MKTFSEIERLVDDVRCPPYFFRVACIECERLDNRLPGVRMVHGPCENSEHVWYLQALLWRQDNDTGEWGWGAGNKLFVSPRDPNGAIVKRCLAAALSYGEHEIREAFEYKGKRIAGPHLSLESMMEAADKTAGREAIKG